MLERANSSISTKPLHRAGPQGPARFVYATASTDMTGQGDSTPDVMYRKLEEYPPLGFDCGRPQQNAFLYDRAWLDQKESLSTTYLFYVEGVLAAYATLFMDSLPLSRRERGPIPYRNVSAVKLGQLGVDRRFQGRGIGRYAVDFSIHLALDVAERVACRYLTLDAESDLVGWYDRFGFSLNQLRQKERMEDAIRHDRDHHAIPVSMRLDLRAL
jgi:GNAT superfamily N-acetyltransferase